MKNCKKTKRLELVVKIEKFYNRHEFILRTYKLAVWLAKRYDLTEEDCDFGQYYHDVKNKKMVTMTLIFK